MIKFHLHPFGFYRGIVAILFSAGVFASILVANGFGQECTLKSVSNPRCSLAVSQIPATMPQMGSTVQNQDSHEGSVRPWLLLASRGMRHEGMWYNYGGHEYGERSVIAFSRIVQSPLFPFLVLSGFLAIVFLAYRLWWYKPLIPVMVVARREIQGVVKSLGKVQFQDSVTVRSQRSGTIEKLHVAQGDRVTRGQVLAELRSSALKDEVKAAPENLVHLVASTDGVITNCILVVGDEVYPGTPIFQIVEAEQIRITAQVSEPRGAQVRAGQEAVIKLGSGQEFEGEVMRVKKDPNPAARQYEIMVKFRDLPDPALIGEEAAVIITTGRQTAPAVPITAVTSRNDQHGLLVVDDGLVYFRPISIGVQDGKWTAALTGVKEGELVMINAKAAKPGKEVRAEVMTAAFVEG